MKTYIQSFLLSILLTCSLPFTVAADEVTDVINNVAVKLVQQLPTKKKIALKSLSPEETGLPEDFLRKLTSDLEAALLTASDFEINLANRTTMEDVWQEAVEFNNADFDQLFKSANADVMLMMSPRAISTGVEIAITAYSLTGDDVGKILASSGSTFVPIDLQANLGIDVNNINNQMAQVLAEIEQVGQTGGLITNANTYAEYYHNARLLQQRGEVDLAMQNYEQALERGYLFVDPLLELLDLANARYGGEGAKKYFEKKISRKIPSELSDVASVLLDLKNIKEIYPTKTLTISGVFTPALAVWLNKKSIQEISDNTNYYERKYDQDYYFMQSARLVLQSYKTAEFQSYFIDKGAGTDLVNVPSLKAALQKLNRFEFSVSHVDYKALTSKQHLRILECEKSNEGKTSWAEGIKLGIINNAPLSIQKTKSRLGARPMCSGINYANNEKNYWNEEGSQLVRVFSNDDGYLVSGEISTGETAECPFMPQLDRIIFAEMCGEKQYNVINRLLITDNVDTSQPIILRIGLQGAEERLLFYETDISVDGTYVSKLPAPIASHSSEGMYYYEDHSNGWFFAPGIIQSSIQSAIATIEPSPLPAVFQIDYTDIYGNLQTTRNSVISNQSCCWADKNYVWKQDYGWDGETNYPIVRSKNELASVVSSSLGGYHSYLPQDNPSLSRFYSGELSPAQKPLMCSMSARSATIINVENFTNLRHQAGLNGQVIARIGLGEKVRIIDPGRYLRYDRCAAACEGNNQSAIIECIDNNDVWIEVQYKGRRGFLSRKFLE